jgi:hypothetical protein
VEKHDDLIDSPKLGDGSRSEDAEKKIAVKGLQARAVNIALNRKF